MSGGRTLAECLARALSAPCVGREIVVEVAARLGVPDSLLREKIETSPGFFDRFSAERRTYVLAVQAALAEHAATGRLVYHGQAGHLLLRHLPGVLRVRLIAPLASRVRAVMEEYRVSEAEAADRIRRLDHERARWTKAMYGVDIADPSLYDLVLNLETITVHTACAAIQGVLQRPEFEIDNEVLGRIRAFAASCRAQLEAHQALRGPPAPGPIRILVVDDDAAFGASIAKRLEAAGHVAVLAEAPKDATRLAATRSYDVVLLNLDLAHGQGLAVLREIRSLDGAVQVVALGNRGTVASAIEGMQTGAADFLRKPVEFDSLCRAIDAAAHVTRSNRSQGV